MLPSYWFVDRVNYSAFRIYSYYVPIRKIKLCNNDMKWHSWFSYDVARIMPFYGQSTAGLCYWMGKCICDKDSTIIIIIILLLCI